MGSMLNSQERERARIIPIAIDDAAASAPDRTWVTIPRTPDLKQGWQDVSFLQLAHAVNGMCWWLEDNNRNADLSTVVAYMGIQDHRYTVVTAAVIKLGHKIMLPSPRNSLEGSISLFEKTACKLILCSEDCDLVITPITTALSDVSRLQIPSFDVLENIGSSRGRFQSRCNLNTGESCIVLHSSGSTGLPKPVYLKTPTLTTISNMGLVQFPSGRRCCWGTFNIQRPMFSMLPHFHAMGVVGMVRCAVDQAPMILHPAQRPPSPESILEVIRQTRPFAAFLAPSIIEDLVKLPEGVEALSHIEYIFFGGAPLNVSAGDKVCEYSTPINVIGSTETWSIPILHHKDKADWRWFEFAPGSGVNMEHEDGDVYEMVIKREDDIAIQGTFHNFPELDEYRTKDLYTQHPTKPELYQFTGRKDDVIVLSSGEKFNPIDFEKLIETHPSIRGALVVGDKRFQAGLIVEPFWDKISDNQDSACLIEAIWPMVSKANEGVSSYAQVWKSKIHVSGPRKPFKRAPKGSIMRRATNELYADEIDRLLSNTSTKVEVGTLEKGADLVAIRDFLRSVCRLVLSGLDDGVTDDTDFFRLGTNSLQVLDLSNTLKQAIGDDFVAISARDIYGNPSIDALANFIWTHSTMNGAALEQEAKQDRAEAISKMIDRFTADLPRRSASPSKIGSDKSTVLLTGSTGSLGNYLLEYLIADENVAKVYCLNRSEDAQSRQKESFSSRGTAVDFSKVVFLQADFGMDRFGLSGARYDELVSEVDTFIHNAWPVDFNKSLKSYEEVHIGGVRRIVDFSFLSKNCPRIVFISSVAAIGRYHAVSHSTPQSNDSDASVPEMIVSDPTTPLNQGYGESKYVSERILAYASQQSGVPVTVIRCGQLAGPSPEANGIWNKHEWLPSIVATSEAMGVIPDSLGNQNTIDWVPTDLAARIVLELTLRIAKTNVSSQAGYERRSISNDSSGSSARKTSIESMSQDEDDRVSEKEPEILKVYHLINPKHSTWTEDILPAIEHHYNHDDKDQKMKRVPLTTWLSTLQDIASTHSGSSNNSNNKEPTQTSESTLATKYPAIKLLDFYQGLLQPAQKSSSTKEDVSEHDNLHDIDGDNNNENQPPRFMLDTQLTTAKSRVLREMRAIDAELMGRWLGQWQF